MKSKTRRGEKKTGSVKIAISLPREEADYVERLRRLQKTSRSAVIRDAIREKVLTEKKAEDIKRYIEGYQRMPETEEEIAELQAMQQSALESLPKEDW